MQRMTIRFIVISVVGTIISYREISEVDHTFFMDVIINIALEFIAAMIFVWVIFKDIRECPKLKTWKAFLPTITGCLISIFLLTILHIYDLRDRSPIKFSCVSKIVDFNGVHIDFREDGTYRLDNFCMGSDFFRGTYSLKDSVITLDKSDIDKVIVSNRLIIRADGEKDSSGNIGKSIYQVDRDGNVIYSAVDYRVVENPNDNNRDRNN
jgi:hypothetical protein